MDIVFNPQGFLWFVGLLGGCAVFIGAIAVDSGADKVGFSVIGFGLLLVFSVIFVGFSFTFN